MKPRRAAFKAEFVALAVAAAAMAASYAVEPAPKESALKESASNYVGRPIYSDPTNGLQLPPHCVIEPTWRSRITGTEMEVWVLKCDALPRAWLLTRQVVEMLNAHDARLRFQVLDERLLPDETVGDSLSVQCAGETDAPGLIVYGARWRPSGHELHLAEARGGLRVDVARRRLTDADPKAIDCVRFPDREAMMRKLQQPEGATR